MKKVLKTLFLTTMSLGMISVVQCSPSGVVENIKVTSISIKTAPNKLTYKKGESIDLTGLVVEATYSDKTTKEVPLNELKTNVSDIDMKVSGTKTVTVTYQEKTASFDISVEASTSIVRAVDVANANIIGTTLEVGSSLHPGANKITVTGGIMFYQPTYGGFTEENLSHIFVIVNGVNYHPTELPEVEEVEKIESVDVDVIIPEGEVTVFIFFQTTSTDEEGHTISIVEGSEHARVYGVEPNGKYKYFNAYLNLDNGYLLDSAEYRVKGSETWTTLRTNLRSEFNMVLYTFTIGNSRTPVEGDIELKITSSEHNEYTITYDIDSELSINLTSSVFPTSAIDSLTVNLTVSLTSSALFTVSSTDCEIVDDGYGYFHFIMPAKDVTISIKAKEADVDLSVNTNPDIASYKFLKDDDYYGGLTPITKGISGTTVYLFVSIEGNKKPTGGVTSTGSTVKFTYKGLDNDDTGNTRVYGAPISLPEEATSVSVQVTVEEAHSATIDENQAIEGLINLSGGNTLFANGENVIVLFTVEDYNLIIKNSEGTVVDITQSDYTSRRVVKGKQFAMPNYDVALSLEAK